MQNDSVTKYLGQLVIVIFVMVLTYLVVFGWTNETFNNLVVCQFKVIVLIPVAALFSFVLIALFQSFSGNVEFKLLGMEFSGASGPVVMWVLAFISIVISINFLWEDAMPTACKRLLL